MLKEKTEATTQLVERYQQLVITHANTEKQLQKEREDRLKLQNDSSSLATDAAGCTAAPQPSGKSSDKLEEELRLVKSQLQAERRNAEDALRQLQQEKQQTERTKAKLKEVYAARAASESKLQGLQAEVSCRTDGLQKQIQQLQADLLANESMSRELKTRYDSAVRELGLLHKNKAKTVPTAVPSIEEFQSLQRSLQAAKSGADKQAGAAAAERQSLREQLQGAREEAARSKADLQKIKKENERLQNEVACSSVKSGSLQVGHTYPPIRAMAAAYSRLLLLQVLTFVTIFPFPHLF